jgi:hypothetical protein
VLGHWPQKVQEFSSKPNPLLAEALDSTSRKYQIVSGSDPTTLSALPVSSPPTSRAG